MNICWLNLKNQTKLFFLSLWTRTERTLPVSRKNKFSNQILSVIKSVESLISISITNWNIKLMKWKFNGASPVGPFQSSYDISQIPTTVIQFINTLFLIMYSNKQFLYECTFLLILIPLHIHFIVSIQQEMNNPLHNRRASRGRLLKWGMQQNFSVTVNVVYMVHSIPSEISIAGWWWWYSIHVYGIVKIYLTTFCNK